MADTFNNLFFSIGAMKAGTTWLYAVLSKHPQLMVAPEKEIHYFHDRDLGSQHLARSTRFRRAHTKYVPILQGDGGRKEFPKSRAQRAVQMLQEKVLPNRMPDLTGVSPEGCGWVKNYLSEPVDDAWFNGLFPTDRPDAYACEFSNLSALLPEATWRDLTSHSNKVRVLYTLRDPVDRLWSHTKFALEMTNRLDLLDSWKPEDFDSYARKSGIWEHGEYGQICDVLLKSLPQEARHIQSYEDMKAAPLQTIRKIEDFLGLDAHAYPKWVMERRPVKSKSVPMPDFYRDLFKDDVARIKRELADLGLSVQDRWK